MNRRITLALATAAAFSFVCAGISSPASAQIPDVPGWQLSWHDEFDGPTVSTQNWDVLTRRNNQNNELQYYRPEQASIVGGNLRITATNQPLDGKPYRSARLESWQTFGPGRFEARIDLPTTQGMWPAFWLYPRAVQWPTRGEIDIMENRGSQPTIVSSAYHWQTNPGPCCSQHQFVFENYSTSQGGNPVNFHNDFHVYAVEWEATRLRFYVDGTLHYTVNELTDRPIFETPMNIILNLAVGGDFGNPDGTTVFPQQMNVDYVRVWQRPTGVAGDYNGDSIVDASDYAVWRKSLGQTGIGLDADGSGNGTVGQEDYIVWQANFDSASMAAAATMAAFPVPEPAAAIPMAVSFMLVYAQRFRLAPSEAENKAAR